MSQKIFSVGALFAMFSVAFGAFGAHYLKNKISIEMLTVFEVGVRYQFYHSLAIMLVAVAIKTWSVPTTPAYFFISGIILFSGSLYVLSLTGIKYFGAITPIGGGMFLIGWILLAYNSFKNI